MIDFILCNKGTIIVGAVLLVIIVFILRKILRDYQNGKRCAYNCSSCPLGNNCDKKRGQA